MTTAGLSNGSTHMDAGNQGIPAERSSDNANGRSADASAVAGMMGGGSHSGVSHQLRQETEAARAILANMADLLGDDQEAIASTVEGETNLHETILKAISRVLELNGMMNGIVGMIASLKDRGERLEKQRDNLKELIAVAMETGQLRRVETGLATVTLKATPPKVEVVNEAIIPPRFWKPQDPKLDKKELLKALKEKQAIPGATLSNGGVTAAFKVD